MPLQPGEVLDHFEIVAAIDAGGMGEVYKARDRRLDRTVAIKVLRQQFTERFTREAQSIAALNHSHICQLYDVGPNYLVMEFIDGAPLKGPLSQDKATEYAIQILDALAEAHRKGIVHRDLKPANILLTKQGVKVVDFGLAKRSGVFETTENTLTQALTGEGQIVGTIQYMSPEQLEGREVDARSDLFAFGCILYELISGRRAFAGDSPASVIAKILERDPEPLQISPPLDRVIQRCLAKDPDSRFQSAIDLKTALLWAVEPSPAAATGTRSLRWKWIAAAATLLAAVSIGAYVARKPSEPTTVRLEFTPPEQEAVSNPNVEVSPDGTKVVFGVSVNGVRQLRVRRLDSIESTLVPGSEGAFAGFWSPDSRHLAFHVNGKVKRVNVSGGAAETLCDLAESVAPFGAWSPSGYILLSDQRGMVKIPETGGIPEVVIERDRTRGELYARHPKLLPDGRRFLYLVTDTGGEEGTIYVGQIDEKNSRDRRRVIDSTAMGQVVNGLDGQTRLLFVRDQSLMSVTIDPDTLRPRGEPVEVTPRIVVLGGAAQFSATNNGVLVYVSGLRPNWSVPVWFDVNGRRLGDLGEARFYRDLDLSPRSGHALVTVSEGQSRTRGDLWVEDLERKQRTRLTFDKLSISPVWSPDESRVAFRSRIGDQKSGIYIKSSNGAGDAQLASETARAAGAYPTSWSGDGKKLLYTAQSRTTSYDIHVFDFERKSSQPLLTSPAREAHAQFSPDGRFFAYQSDESNVGEIYVQPFPPNGGKWQISAAGGTQPRWRGDGKELFYLAAGGMLTAVDINRVGNGLEAGARRELFPVGRTVTILFQAFTYDVTSDGKRFLVLYPEADRPVPITVALNWTAGLEK